MEEEDILLLAQQFLNTPQGQKLLDKIGLKEDVNSINLRIKDLEEDLSREEKRELRQERRETRRGVRQQKREDRKAKRREEIQQLRAQLKGNIPVIKQFTVKGRLYDETTGDPLEGVEIKALEASIFKGGREERQELRDRRQEAREERRDIRATSSEELEKLREAARKENQTQREYNREAKRLDDALTQEEINRRGKAIAERRTSERNFDTKQAAYFGGISGNDAEGNPQYYGYYSPVQLSKAKNALDKFLAERKDQIGKTKVSKYQTDENGEFEAVVNIVVLPAQVTIRIKDEETGDRVEKTVDIRSNDVSILNPKLLYTEQGYVPKIQELLNLDRTIKSDLPTESLINVDEAAEQAKNEINNEIDNQIEKANSIFLDGVEILIDAKRKSIMKVVNIIKTRLVPLAIGLLILFGISKLSQKDQKVCPSPDQLKDAIRRRNRIVKQLNQIFKAIAINSAFAAAFALIGLQFKNVRFTIDNLPIPLATQPYTLVSKLQNINDLLERLEQENKKLNKQILIALIFLVASLIIILLLLRGIDKLIQECAQEELSLEEIDEELLALIQEAEEEGDPSVRNVNGFILSVETEKNGVGTIKRRFAVAKNADGVILLKGEPSFSASDQILIDELVFYIQQNNLKAN